MGERSERGLYRGVFTRLLDDPDFQALSPTGRHVLLTLRLCGQNTIGSIFRYYPALLCAQTGYAPAQIDGALAELGREPKPWIVRDAAVLWIRNGLRFDPALSIDSDPKHRRGIERALVSLPKSPVIQSFCDYYRFQMPYPSEGPSEALLRPSGGPVTPNRNRNTSRKKEYEKENEQSERASVDPTVSAAPTRELALEHPESAPATVTDALGIAWNEHAPDLRPVRLPLSKTRATSARARLKQHGLPVLVEAITRMNRSPVCTSEKGRSWADFDFFLRPDTASKALEGKYDTDWNAAPGGNPRLTRNVENARSAVDMIQGRTKP